MYGGGLVSSKTGVYAEIYLVRACSGIIVNIEKKAGRDIFKAEGDDNYGKNGRYS